MAIVDRQIVTAGVEEMCKSCQGRRYLTYTVGTVDDFEFEQPPDSQPPTE
ncbi:hypothetical protein [Rhizohabitans arisaemae]|nr:hypothetical protein [Rhizohabitans arisaemae]